MPETRELFELVRRQLRVDDVPLATLERRRRKRDRDRKLGVFTLVAAIVVGAWLVSSSITLPDGTRPNQRPSAVDVPLPGNQVIQIHADGTGEQVVEGVPAVVDQPVLSPDGTRLAFVTVVGENLQIATTRSDGGDLRVLTHRPIDAQTPAWSPDGASIAFYSTNLQGNRDIYVMDTDGGHVRRLTNGPLADLAPAWSPDGSSIAFFSSTNVNFDTSSPSDEIWVIPAAGGQATQLTRNHVADIQPEWSPDGTQIAFVRGPDAHLWVMDADGNDQHEIFGVRSLCFAPRWSPDGTRIAFLTFDAHELGTVPLPGPSGATSTAPLLTVRILDLAIGQVSSVGVRVAGDVNEVSWVSNDTLLIRKVDE
jgi:Dipeptidyl peptidase IV (DPP IV) N-terminal region/WD40-like Beta Propeller Repeat